MLGLIIIGCASGLVAAAAALITGASYGIAFVTYCLAGSTGMVMTAAARASLAEMLSRRNTDHDAVTVGAGLLAATSGEMMPEKASDLQKPAHGMRILAVDDDPFIRELVPMISAEAGFPDVVAVASGWDALALLGIGVKSDASFAAQLAQDDTGTRQFDCLLLDINMPEMDGIELCRQLRGIPAYRDVPVIMLTALRDMKNLDGAFRAGATDYTTKPFDVIEFGARLRLAQERIEAQANGMDVDGADVETSVHAGLLRPTLGRGSDQQIAGMANLIEQRALTNYLSQMHRSELPKTAVMAVQIDQLGAIAPTVSTQHRIAVLRDVADAISAVIGAEQCQIAYAGHGVFLIVAQNTAIASRDIEAETNLVIALKTGAGQGLGPDALTVSVGEPVEPNGRKAQRAELAFRRAMLAVNRRKLFDHSHLQLLSAAR